MGSVKLNTCPRCKGTLFLQQDFMKDWHEECLQCGYVQYMDTIVDISGKNKSQGVCILNSGV